MNHDRAMRAILDLARVYEGVREVIYNPRKPWPEIVVTVSPAGLADARRGLAPLVPVGVGLVFTTTDVGAGVLATGAKREPITRAPRLPRADYPGCHSDNDGDCTWSGCPQLRDGEPERSGRHCPRDRRGDNEE